MLATTVRKTTEFRMLACLSMFTMLQTISLIEMVDDVVDAGLN